MLERISATFRDELGFATQVPEPRSRVGRAWLRACVPGELV
jgi:hypothetical protein